MFPNSFVGCPVRAAVLVEVWHLVLEEMLCIQKEDSQAVKAIKRDCLNHHVSWFFSLNVVCFCQVLEKFASGLSRILSGVVGIMVFVTFMQLHSLAHMKRRRSTNNSRRGSSSGLEGEVFAAACLP